MTNRSLWLWSAVLVAGACAHAPNVAPGGDTPALAARGIEPVCGTAAEEIRRHGSMAGSGRILVTVLDPDGFPLPGATVRFASRSGDIRAVETDRNGHAKLSPAGPDRLVVSVALPGFRSAVAEGVRSAPGCITAVSFALPLVYPICEVTVSH